MAIIHNFQGFINEAVINSQSIKDQLGRIKDTKTQLEELRAEMKRLEEELKTFDTEIKPLFDQMKDAQDRIATAEGFVVKITTFAHERNDVTWKSVVDLALTNLDEAARAIVADCIEANKRITRVKHSFTIEEPDQVDESLSLKSAKAKVLTLVSSLINKIKSKLGKMDKAVAKLKKLSERMAVKEGLIGRGEGSSGPSGYEHHDSHHEYGKKLRDIHSRVEKIERIAQLVQDISGPDVKAMVDSNPEIQMDLDNIHKNLDNAVADLKKLLNSTERIKAIYGRDIEGL